MSSFSFRYTTIKNKIIRIYDADILKFNIDKIKKKKEE